MTANGNDNKNKALGEPYGTASAKLRKMILFSLIRRLELDVCFRCGKKIESIEDLSIEHIEAWLNSDSPREKFYDLNNIAFSHLRCNSSCANRDHVRNPILSTRIVDKEDTAWCSGCQRELDKKQFHKNKYRWSGLQSRCIECRSREHAGDA